MSSHDFGRKAPNRSWLGVQHIHADGRLESHADALSRLAADTQFAGTRYVPFSRRAFGRSLPPSRGAHCVRSGEPSPAELQARGCGRMKLFTIGFTKKSAETFFTRLTNAGVKRLVDVRLNNVSQLAGFTKRDDLTVLHKSHMQHRLRASFLILRRPKTFSTPTRNRRAIGRLYERQFLDLMRSRHIEEKCRATCWMAGVYCAARKTPIIATAALLLNI